MSKFIPVLSIMILIIGMLLCGCSKTIDNETTTESNEYIESVVEKSKPVTTGNLITKTNNDKDGNLYIEYYDNNGNLVENYKWNDDKEELEHSVMKYDENNKILNKESIDPSGLTTDVVSYKYDSEQNISESIVSEYDKGLLKKSTVYDASDKIVQYTEMYYNDKELLTKVEKYDKDKKLTGYYMYEYNSDDSRTKASVFDKDGNLLNYTAYKYNANNQCTEEKNCSADGTLLGYCITEYYESGNIKSKQYFDEKGNLESEDTFEDNK